MKNCFGLILFLLLAACRQQEDVVHVEASSFQELAVGQSWKTIQSQSLSPPSLQVIRQERVVAEFDRALGFASSIEFASRKDFEEAVTGKRFIEIDQVISRAPEQSERTKWLVYGAWISAVGRSFDDAFHFYAPHQAAEIKKRVTGVNEGAGVDVGIHSGLPTVQEVAAEGPAARAGIQKGSKILSVEDQDLPEIDLTNASSSDVEQMLTGPAGSHATVRISGPKGEERVDLLRANWVDDSLRVQARVSSNMWIISVPGFYVGEGGNSSSSSELRSAISKTQGWPYVLDLRSNPGGSIDQAVEVASVAGAKGGLWVVSSRSARMNFEAASSGDRLPAAVWVNSDTGPAAEIVAWSLQEKGVPVIGNDTRGPLLMQVMVPLDRDSFLKTSRSDTGSLLLTTARLLIDDEANAMTPDCKVRQTVAKQVDKEYSNATKACLKGPRE